MIGGGEVRTITGTYDWGAPHQVVTLPGSWHNSAVLLDDGRILIAASGGGTISLYHSASASDFIAGAWTYSNTLLTGSDYATGANVFRAPNGTIYMAVSDKYGRTVTQKIYVCADSSGLSWSLHGTVESVSPNDKFRNDSSITGIPYFKSASEWILSAPRFLTKPPEDEFGHRQDIWRSTDTGVTWSVVHEQQYYLLWGIYGEGQSQYVINSASKYRWSSTGNPGQVTWALSNDGVSWSTSPDMGSYIGYHTFFADDLGYYVTNGDSVYRFTGDYLSGTETLMRAPGYSWTNIDRFPTMTNITAETSPAAWCMILGTRMICPTEVGGLWTVGMVRKGSRGKW